MCKEACRLASKPVLSNGDDSWAAGFSQESNALPGPSGIFKFGLFGNRALPHNGLLQCAGQPSRLGQGVRL